MAYDGSLIFDTKIDNKGFKKGVEGMKSTAASSMKAVNNVMKIGATAIAGIGIASAKVGMEFESSMSQVAATMGITVEEINSGSKSFETLKNAAKEAGRTTMFSSSEASEALNYLALAGYDVEDSVSMLPKVLNLAGAGGLELAYASDMVTDSMGALGLGIEDADGYIDQLAKTSQKSNTDIGQLGEAILTVGASARDLKGGTVELNTAIGLLGNVGIKGSEAGTKLRNVIMAMTPTTEAAAAAFEHLGIETYDANGEMRGLDEIFGDLNESMKDMTTEEKKNIMGDIFNKQDMAAAMALLVATSGSVDDLGMAMDELGVPIDKVEGGIEALVDTVGDYDDAASFATFATEEFGLTAEEAEAAYGILTSAMEGDAWANLEAEIRDSEGAAQDLNDTLNDNLRGDMELFKSALSGLGIEIYEGFNKPLRNVVQTLTDYTSRITDTLTVNKKMKEDMLELGLTAADLGHDIEDIPTGFMGMAQVMGEVFAEILTELMGFAPKLIELGAQLISSFLDGFRENLPEITNAAVEMLTGFTTSYYELMPEIMVLGIELVTNLVRGMMESMPEITMAMMNAFTSITESISENLPIMLQAGMEIVLSLGEGIFQAMPEMIETAFDIINKFADAIIRNLPEIMSLGTDMILEMIVGITEGYAELIPVALEIITTIVKGITQNLPKIIRVGTELIKDLTKSLTDNMPEILKTALELVEGLVKGLLDNVGLLMESAIEIVEALVDFLIDNIDMLIDVALDLTMAIVDGLIDNLPELITAAIQLVLAIVEGLINNLPKLVSAGIDLVLGIVNGLLDAVPQLIGAGVQLVMELIGAILRLIPQIISTGVQLVGELVAGIIQSLGTIVQIGVTIVNSFIEGIGSMMSGVVSIGKDIVRGLWQGINSMVGWIGGKIKGFAEGITSSFKGFFGIKSPSTLMAEYGKNIAEGLAMGIKDNASEAEKAMYDMAKSIVSEYDRLGDAVMTALKERYRQEEQARLDTLRRQVDVLRRQTDEKIKEYEREYRAKFKTLDEETSKEEKALQAQIDAINNRTSQEEKELKERQYQKDLAEKKAAIAQAKDDKEKLKLQEDLNQMIARKEREVLLEQRQMQIESLRDEMVRVRDQAAEKRKELEDELSSKIKNEEDKLASSIKYYDNEMEAVKRHYEHLMTEEELQAEARHLMLDENNEDLIDLLETYNPHWQNAGQSFGESLLVGLNSMKASIQSEVNDILAMVNQADRHHNVSDERHDDTAANREIIQAKRDWEVAKAKGDKAAMDAAEQLAKDMRAQGGTIGADVSLADAINMSRSVQREMGSMARTMSANQTHVVNNDKGVTQNVTIVSPENTPSENARKLKQTGKELALGY